MKKTKNIVEKNIAFVLRNYIEAKYEYVILTWVLHKQSIIDRLLSKLSDLKFKVHIFTLIAGEDVLLNRSRTGTKSKRDPEIVKDRLIQSSELKTKKFNTTRAGPDKIVSRI